MFANLITVKARQGIGNRGPMTGDGRVRKLPIVEQKEEIVSNYRDSDVLQINCPATQPTLECLEMGLI